MAEFGRRLGTLVKQRYMLSALCGRSTYKLTEEIVRLDRLTFEQPPVNRQARYCVCPTSTVDAVVGQNGERLVPSWWSRPVAETIGAGARAVAVRAMVFRFLKRPS
jgi:hypothetical protein